MIILTRWLAVFILLSLTFNPTQYNFVTWVRQYGGENLSLAVLVGLVLLVGYIVTLRASLRSIGGVGMTLLSAIFAALLWVLHDFGVLDLNNRQMNVWLGLFGLSAVFGIGLGWSHVRRTLTGQTDVDDVDE